MHVNFTVPVRSRPCIASESLAMDGNLRGTLQSAEDKRFIANEPCVARSRAFTVQRGEPSLHREMCMGFETMIEHPLDDSRVIEPVSAAASIDPIYGSR